MIDKNRINAVLERYQKNEYWRKIYETAPSGTTKLHFAYDVYYGRTGDREVYAAMRALEEDFTIEDWRHFMTYCGNNPRYARAVEHIRKLEAKAKKPNNAVLP